MYPVFPLNIVVLPDESVALHLFEPRYRQLYKDVKAGQEFAIVYQNKSDRSSHGTLVYIDKVINEFPDDTVDLIVRGLSIIKVITFHDLFPEKLYSGVDAEVLNHENQRVTDELLIEFKKYLTTVGKKHNPSNTLSLFQIANRLELSQEKKNEFIKCQDCIHMNRFLINEIRFFLKIYEQEKNLNHKFHLN